MSDPQQNSGERRARLAVGVLLVLLAAGAAAFRLPRLGERPMHADEAVQAARSRDLWLHGRYVYDPDEFHGPTLQYATLSSLWLSGPEDFADTNEATYRVVPAVFGLGAIVLLWLLADALGKPAVVCAGVLLAISPAMVFYGRYYIHETLLVFFTLAAMGTAWRYLRSGRLRWCLIAGMCVGLMQATKETSLVAYFAAVIGLVATIFWSLLLREKDTGHRVSRPWWHLAAGLGMAVLVAVLLLSSFFTNMRGPVDGVLTYLPWFQRAAGNSPHVHPWHYYLQILAWWQLDDGQWWSAGIVLGLAAVGFVAALLPKRFFLPDASAPLVRWLGFYTLVLTATYSAVPYKTPWCLLQFLLGMILLAGVGAVVLVRLVPTWPLKAVVALVLLAAVGQLGWQSYRTNYVLAADESNPYVYVPTRAKFKELAELVQALDEAWSDRGDFSVTVVWHDPYYWPLPWYLRRWGPIRRWDHLADGPAPAVVVASAQCNQELFQRLQGTHQMPGFYEMRRNVFVVIWVRKDVWQAHLRKLGRL
ncbi:MAG TPA: flippase activity-associated protein Agl23 [Thermoguttaceae bacterium]|nr:flippase activity-associated protein Agl23 [Thermoguttaceae bacterium]